MKYLVPIALSLFLVLALSGCSSTNWAQIQKDEWYTAPGETVGFEKGNDSIAPVIPTKQTQSIESLRDKVFIEIDPAKARDLTGRDFESGSVLLLVRGLQFSSNPEGFAAYWMGTDLWVHHGALSSSTKMTKAPVVVAVAHVPEHVFVSCSVAR